MPRRPLGETRLPNPVYAKALLFKSQWEQFYEGETYIITGKDLKFARELREVNNDEIVRRVQLYFREVWFGEHCRHNLAAFVSNINQFVPQKKDPVKVFEFACPLCGKKHGANEDCTSKNPATPMLNELSKKMQMPRDTTEKEKHNAKFNYVSPSPQRS
jgi:hypothetical protein